MSKCQYELGLIGRDIGYSFSPAYFAAKFAALGLTGRCHYDLFDLCSEQDVAHFLRDGAFHGCNVTQPYKRFVADHCDALHGAAVELKVVNVIRKVGNELHGYNTDVGGLLYMWRRMEDRADEHRRELWREQPVLILGSGGAADACAYVARELGYESRIISRRRERGHMTYDQLRNAALSSAGVMINCTPVGTSPRSNEMPPIDAQTFGAGWLVMDLIYNPEKTLFLRTAEAAGALISNGLPMLYRQADLSWEIWTHGVTFF